MNYPLKNWYKIKRGYLFGVKTFYSDNHLGVDYIVPEGVPVYAPTNCQIIVSNKFPQGGNTVHVSFDDYQYGKLIMRCMHLSKMSKKGNYNKGDILGHTGNTGKYTKGAHLHLDLSINRVSLGNFNNFIDPDEFFIDRTKNKYSNMVTYKKYGEAPIYVLVGSILIPFATSFNVYEKEFKDAKLITLPKEDFKKYTVSTSVKISPK
jgi:hypothetical protein